jgi:tRNA dimethylallyltransferase
MTRKDAVLIAGPTASGKSELALRIAEAVDGVVLNADSMQVYRDLEVLTARPDDAELARAPHRLYGFVAGADAYSVGRYIEDATATLREVRAEGRVPVMVGGTGLYLRALLEGLSPVPPPTDGVRQRWRDEARRVGAAALHAVLAERDPVMARRLVPTDTQRIVRALEVLESTGRSLADWQALPGRPALDCERCVRLVLSPTRQVVYERCDRRFDAMLAGGVLNEVKALAELGLAPDLPIMRAVGVRPLMAHLGGHLTLAEASDVAKTETRNYAKRQFTWLRRNMISWKAVILEDMEKEIGQIVSFVR